MGRLIKKTAFGAGEVDEALIDRTNLEKVQAGLKVGRNIVIAKNGRPMNRMGTLFKLRAKVDTGNVLTIEVPNTNYVLEVTNQNIRRINMSTGATSDVATDIEDAEIASIDYCISSKYAILISGDSSEANYKCVIFFRGNNSKEMSIYDIENAAWYATASYIVLDEYLTKDLVNTFTFVATGAPSGPSVEYAVTVIRPDGQESTAITPITGSPNLPVSSGQYNTITVQSDNLTLAAANEYRFFRRFTDGGAYGYIGSSFDKVQSGTSWVAKFVDYGQTPDYSVNPPIHILTNASAVANLKPKTGEVIGGGLYIGNCTDNPENVYRSRINHPFNFLRDFPLSDDTALAMKAGQSGAADVLKIADAGTIVVFTAIGIFTPPVRGPVTPSNSTLQRVSSAIINEKLPPKVVNDTLIFVDKTDNSIKALDFSNNRQNYSSDDLTIYSGHLFEGKEIVSWAVQKYGDPIVWCVMNDGTVVAFTYKDSQQLRAFCPGDFYNAEVISVTSYGIGADSKVVFLVEIDGIRMYTELAQRYNLTDKELVFADLAVYKNLPLDADGLTLTPVSADDWAGQVRLDSTDASPFNSGMINKIYRAFDELGQAIDFKVISVPAPNQMILGPNPERPYGEVSEQYREDLVLYETFTQMTGLTHLNDYDVSVYCDGAIAASPLNTKDNLPKMTVSDGVLTVPRSAFCTVGLPFVSDIGTFSVSSDDPNLGAKARTTGKAYIRAKNSKGFYVGPEFPSDDTVTGMSIPDLFNTENPQGAALPAQTKKYEVAITNDWKSEGAICIRNVDPVPLELLSIVLNVTIQ